LIVGVLGRAQYLLGVRVFAVAVLSNHLHALLGVDHADQLATFMQYALGNIAKELGRHHRWKGPFWARRYRSIVVADDASQVARLRYVLSQGIKEQLIARAEQWPGVSSFLTLTRGTPMRGSWHGRTEEEQSKENRRSRMKAEKVYELKHTRLPALGHQTEDDHKAYVETIVRAEEDEALAERSRGASKRSVLGPARILAQDPHSAPEESSHGPAPLVHAASASLRASFRDAYRAFVNAFKTAAECLRANLPAHFPDGSFPPASPFIKPQPT
jgi:REP element-mobilizing transposase RayT